MAKCEWANDTTMVNGTMRPLMNDENRQLRPLIGDFWIGRDDGVRDVHQAREECPDMLAALAQICERGDSEIGKQLTVARLESLSDLNRGIGMKHFQTPGICGGDSEYGLAVIAGFDQLAAAVDCDQARGVADVRCEKDRRPDEFPGHVEGIRHRHQMALDRRSVQLCGSQ